MSVESPATRGRVLGLLAILLLAAGLRFTGLSWGLRHTPHYDERVFVESVERMLARGDLDPRFYEYPGLFFYVLAPVLAVVPRDASMAPGAYLAARGVVAAFGVASVGLAYVLGSRLAGSRAGLAAALLLAVSPVEVRTAHMVRPDVVLESFVLLALLAFRRVGPDAGEDARAGAALGAAAAVKFTGVLLLPSYLLSRGLAAGLRVRGLLLAGLTSAAVWLALTPYAALRFQDFVGGVHVQWAYHYKTGAVAPRYIEIASHYVGTIMRGFGPLGAALAAAALLMARREWRSWAPPLAYPLAMIGVLSTAEARWDRLVLSILGVVAVLAGRGIEGIARRAPRAAVAVALVAALPPLVDSAAFVRNVSRPGTRDRALDWIEANLAPGSTVLAAVHELGVDPERFETVWETGKPELDAILARNADLVVWDKDQDPGAVAGLPAALVVEPDSRDAGPRIVMYRVPAASKPRYGSLPLASARLSASSNAGELHGVVDGRPGTGWKSAAPGAAGEWIEVDLRAPARLGRIELVLGNRPDRYGRALVLEVSEDGSNWRRVRWMPGRSAVEEQPRIGGRGPSQVLLFQPTLARAVRLRETGRSDRRWGFAEIRMDQIE